MSELKYVKVRLEDGEISDAILLATDATNIIFDDEQSLDFKVKNKARKDIYKDKSIIFDGSKLAEFKEEDKDVPFLTLAENFDNIVVTGKNHLLRDSTYHFEGDSHRISVDDDAYLNPNGEGHAEGYFNGISSLSHAEGYNNKAKNHSYVTGLGGDPESLEPNNEAAETSIAVGEECAAAVESFVNGYQNDVIGGIFASGEGLLRQPTGGTLHYVAPVCFMSGQYNKNDETNFKVIGGGEFNDRKNLLEVDKDGNLTIQGRLSAAAFNGNISPRDNLHNEIESTYIQNITMKDNNLCFFKGNEDSSTQSISQLRYRLPFFKTYELQTDELSRVPIKNGMILGDFNFLNKLNVGNHAHVFVRLSLFVNEVAKITIYALYNDVVEKVVYEENTREREIKKDICFQFPVDLVNSNTQNVKIKLFQDKCDNSYIDKCSIGFLSPNVDIAEGYEGGIKGKWLN